MRILLTGPSGSGKSTVGRLLYAGDTLFVEADVATHHGTSIAFFRNRMSGLGVDAPQPLPPHWMEDHDWVWRIEVLGQLLAAQSSRTIVVSGDARNRDDALPLFDRVFVLWANRHVLAQRIARRQEHRFGQDPAELTWILEENEKAAREAERMAAVLIDTTTLTAAQVAALCVREMTRLRELTRTRATARLRGNSPTGLP